MNAKSPNWSFQVSQVANSFRALVMKWRYDAEDLEERAIADVETEALLMAQANERKICAAELESVIRSQFGES